MNRRGRSCAASLSLLTLTHLGSLGNQQVCSNPEFLTYMCIAFLGVLCAACCLLPAPRAALPFWLGRMAWSPILLCLAPGQLLVFIELLVGFFLEKKSLQKTRPISLIVELFYLCFLPSVYFCWEGGVPNGFSSYCLLISKYYLNLNTPIYFPASFSPHFTFNPCYFFVVVVFVSVSYCAQHQL